jgi:hypothetical protein
MTTTKFVLPDVTIAVANIGTDESPAYLAYPLTPCCGASGKGGGNGVICRSCYRDVDPMFGDCAPLYEVPGSWPVERIVGGWTDLDDAALAVLVAQIKAVAA